MSLVRMNYRRISRLKQAGAAIYSTSPHGRLHCTTTHASLSEFYKGRSVLVTGCTGFLGQGLIEKLLRSCPEIGTIYVSIRPNRRGDSEQRFNQFLQQKVFDRVRQMNPEFGKKIVPFNGDLTIDNIGLKGDIHARMIEDVSMIFHGAAFIHLSPPLRQTVEANVMASRNVFRFGKKCNNLCAYVHVSTSFINVHLDHIKEEIYDEFISPNELIDLVQNQSDEYLKKNAKLLMGPIPSSYVFSKTVSESILKHEETTVPTAVFRPCFITPAVNDPYPLWTFGNGGYCGIMQNISNGAIRHFAGNPGTPIEMMPVDLVVNSLISVGWFLGTRRHTSEESLVVNVHSSSENPVTVRELVRAVNDESGGQESRRLSLVRSSLAYNTIFTAQYIFPALLKDVLAKIRGVRAKNLVNQLRLRKGMRYISYSTYRNPRKDFSNAKTIHSLLNDSDKKEFYFGVKTIRWNEYLRNWMKMLRTTGKTNE